MRFEVHGFNGGEDYVPRNHQAAWREFIDILESTPYHVQYCAQKDRETEMIFSPSMANAQIRSALEQRGWMAGVPLAEAGYGTGKDVDFYKDRVVLEVQFAHYGLLQADISRIQRLSTGELGLAGGLGVSCGIELVVTNAMPRSQSVAHLEQARKRAASEAPSVPIALVGILPPEIGELVTLHTVVPRSRRSTEQRQVKWKR